MLKVDPVETLARQNCESILIARYAAQSTALTLSPSATAISGRSHYSPLAGRFKCKYCGKTFATYQALGGHTSSHAKHSFPVHESARSIAAVHEKTVPETRRLKVHMCNKCHLQFPTGQALGGHMRRHFDLSSKRKRVDDDGEIQEKRIQTVPFLRAPVKKEDEGEIIEEEEKIKTVPFSCAPEKLQVSLLDLNLPPVDEDSRNGFCS